MIGEERPIPIKLTNPGNVDWYYGGGNTAYATTADALSAIPAPVRFGKTVGILDGETIVEYWFAAGDADSDLVLKISGSSGGTADLSNYYTKVQSDGKFLSGVTKTQVTTALGYVPLSGYTVDFSDYYNKSNSDSRFQAAGNFLSASTLNSYYTKLQSDAKYLTGFTVDFSDYYTKEQTDAKYLTGYTVDFSNYYNKTAADAKFQATGNYVSASTLNQYQLAGNYVSAATLSQYQLAGNYASASTLNDYYTKVQSDAKYLTGFTVDLTDYYTKAQSDARFTGSTVDLSNYYTKTSADTRFQIAGSYLTGVTKAQVTTALGYTPGVSATTLAGYGIVSGDTLFDAKYLATSASSTFLTGVTKTQVTTALGYTPASGSTTLAGYGIASGDTLFDVKYNNDEWVAAAQFLGSPLKGTTIGIDPSNTAGSGNYQLESGRFFGQIIKVPTATILSGVSFYLTSSGAYTATGDNRIGLYTYNQAGLLTLVASTANNANLYKGTDSTYLQEPFSAPYSAAAGFYFLVFFYNNTAETTAPSFMGVPYSITTKLSPLTTNSARMAFQSVTAGNSAIASTITFSSATKDQNRAYWAGVY